MVSEWSAWSTCSAECGGGEQSRTRTIITEPANGGAACPVLEETQACNEQPCAIDCVVSEWSAWSTCSAECGGGEQSRTRTIITEPANGGAACPVLEETQACNEQPCAGPLYLSPAEIDLPTLAQGSFTVTLANPAGPGGQIVSLLSSDTSVATVPDSITFAEGEISTSFEVTTLDSAGSVLITATAGGLGEHSAIVNVSLRELELSVFNPLIGTDRSPQATIQLALPAPVGVTTLSITSSAPAIASVSTSSIEMVEGETSAIFQINGLTIGEADISVSAPGFASASTLVFITEDMILIGILETLAPDQVGSLPIILSKPAPVGGVTVSLTSSNPSVAFVSPSVTVAEGETIASTNAQVTGVSFGTVTLTSSAPGYAPDYAELTVTLILTFTPSYVYVTAGETENITLGLSAPAPSTGLTLNLTSDDPSLATVPASITVPSGQSSVQVPVSGVDQGNTWIHAGAPGIESVTASVRVNPPPSINIYNYTVHYNLQQRTSLYLQKVAPAGGVTVTLTSSDPSRVILSKSPVTVGNASISFNMSAGGYTEIFYIQSLADSGNVQITASAPGYADSFSQISLAPTGFWIGNGPNCPISCYDSFEVSSFDSNYTLNIGVRTPNSTQRIRAGLTIEVPIVSSNPSVGVFTEDSVIFSQNQYQLNTQFDPLAMGTTTLSVVQPPGFSPVAAIQTEVTANVVAPSVQLPPSIIVGKDLQEYLDYRLGGYPPDPVNVTVEVEDDSIALISADPEAAGARYITLTDVDVTRALPAIYVQGLRQGTTTLTVSATGYTPATSSVQVYPSGFYFGYPYTPSFDMFISQNQNINVEVAALSPGTLTYYERQDIRGGHSVAVEVTSSDTAVGVITSSPIVVSGGNHYGSTSFEALAAGSTTLSLIQPPGFSIQSDGIHALTANVSVPTVFVGSNILVDDAILIGKDLQTAQFSYIMDVYPPTPVEVTFRVGDSSIALISNNRTEVGGQSMSVTEMNYNVRLYLQGLQEGSTTLTVSAPGYQTSSYPIEVLPSGFILMQPYSDFNTDVFAENTRITVFPGFPSDTPGLYYSQEVRAGLTVDVPVVSSDTRVGVITDSPLTFLAGLYPYYLTTYFDPLAGGSTTLSVIQPPGFTEPASHSHRTATVEAPDIRMWASLTVGKDLQDVLVINLESAPPVPVDLTVSVVDANITIISDSRTTMGSSTITFHGVSDTAARRVYVQGLSVGDTELRAQAIGFNDAVTEVEVNPSALYIAWPFNNFIADAADPAYEVTVFTAPLDRTTLQYACSSSDSEYCWLNPSCIPLEVHSCSHPEIRGGLTVTVPIQSSDPSVGMLSADSLTFVGGQDNVQTVELDLVGSGDMELSITPPAGFSMPANRNTTIQGTVRGIGSSPLLETYIGRIYSYDVDASHPAPDYFFLLTTAPTGMTIDETTGMIQWISEESQLGDHTVTVELHDNSGLVDTQSFTLSVLEVDPNNRAPMIISWPIDQATEGIPYTYYVEAIDYDEGEVLTFSFTTAPDGMSIDSVTGVVEWTPGVGEAGDYDVVLMVQDVTGAAATQRYLLTVSTIDDLDQDFDGFTVNDGDCNDSDPFINPGVVDVAGNDIDEDCDGEDALTSIRMDSGMAHIRIPLGTSKNIGYSINFDAVETDTYNLIMSQNILPDTGGITIMPELPAMIATDGTKSMHLGQTFTGNTLGTFQVISQVTVDETGQTASVPIQVEVTTGEMLPVLKPLGVMPDAIPLSQTTNVMFKTILTGTKEAPETIEVEEVDENGTSLGVLGSLVDDGTNGDLTAGDYVYSGTFPVDAPADDGIIRFRAKAIFSGVAGTYYSETSSILTTRFQTDFNLTNPSSLVPDPGSGAPIVSNRITLGFIEDTTPDTIETIVGSVEGTVIGIMHSIGVFSVEIPDTGDGTGVSSAITTLQAYPQVEFAEPVHIGIMSAVAPNDELYWRQDAIKRARVDEAWVLARGDGVTIAILDSGIDPGHPDLASKLVQGLVWDTNFVLRPGEDAFTPIDDNGHGTLVAGVAGAETNNNAMGIAGTTWDSKIYPIRVAYWDSGLSKCLSDEDSLARGILHAAKIGAKVINISLAGTRDKPVTGRAVAYAHRQGSLVVAAAGNENNDAPNYPAAYRQAMAVGATMPDPSDVDKNVRWEDSPTKGSNHGDWVGIAAQGKDVWSTFPTYEVSSDPAIDLDAICPLAERYNKGCYLIVSGTSMAAPIVSGAAALLWSVNPEWENEEIRERLERTAAPMLTSDLGAGGLDIFEAIFNGSFEMGGLYEWDATAETGNPPSIPYDIPAAYSVNEWGLLDPPYNPDPVTRRDPNRRMAFIGNDGSERTRTTLSRTFYVQPGVWGTYLSYDYTFVTEEFPEYYSGNCPYDDYMTVTVTGPSGADIYFMFEHLMGFNLEEYDWYNDYTLDIGELGFNLHPYDIHYGPCTGSVFENSVTGAVQEHVRGVYIPFSEGPGNYTISISISDNYDSIVDSAVVIDNIRFRPE